MQVKWLAMAAALAFSGFSQVSLADPMSDQATPPSDQVVEEGGNLKIGPSTPDNSQNQLPKPGMQRAPSPPSDPQDAPLQTPPSPPGTDSQDIAPGWKRT